jgi:hypothetical protein
MEMGRVYLHLVLVRGGYPNEFSGLTAFPRGVDLVTSAKLGVFPMSNSIMVSTLNQYSILNIFLH